MKSLEQQQKDLIEQLRKIDLSEYLPDWKIRELDTELMSIVIPESTTDELAMIAEELDRLERELGEISAKIDRETDKAEPAPKRPIEI